MSPKAIKIIFIILGAFYFFSWIDLIPDRVHPLIGRLDDIAVIGFLVWRYKKSLAAYTARARETTSKQQSSGESHSQSQSNTKPFDPYEILGVSRNSPPQEIEGAYRKLMSQYHPDKVNHLGEELQRVAHEKTLQIQKAYEQIRAS